MKGSLIIVSFFTVSYTHLDVYKRQPQQKQFNSSLPIRKYSYTAVFCVKRKQFFDILSDNSLTFAPTKLKQHSYGRYLSSYSFLQDPLHLL